VLKYCNRQCCSALSICSCIFLILGWNRASLVATTNQGRRQRADQWCPPPPPLKPVPPLFMFAPGCCGLKKCVPFCHFCPPCWEIMTTGVQPTDPVFTLTSLQPRTRSCTFSSLKDYYLVIYLQTKWMAKYKRDLTRKILNFMQNKQGLADCGCKHAWAQKTWKPWKTIMVTIWMLQGFLFSWLFWVMKYEVAVWKWKTCTLAFTSNCNIFFWSYETSALMYVLPVTTASAKCSFSFIGHLKVLPPNDRECAPQRLNHLMILSVHRNCTESLNVL